MASLAKVVSALQRELSSALAQNIEFEGGGALQLEKVVVSLRFAAQEKGNGDVQFSWSSGQEVADSTSGNHPHSLTIEFKVAALTSTQAALGISEKSPTSGPKPAHTGQIKDSLSRIFGAPGFDSSARATVFREAFAELSPEQVQLVIDSISGSAPEHDAQAKRSRSLLLKLVRSAPLESPEEGTALLTQLFQQNSLDAILNLVGREWKTQEDWL